ncbi:alcohol oxidase [Corynespora cassiicola Philippines]|uniref:Alcohol oxidase n=1 Tax=Corynespora cassiicola Philippines TaxID=1448308 RepID=A0A2T2NVV8_CORCC|nr:alcohol oxidase [Corynespora cassiicola Philippines]
MLLFLRSICLSLVFIHSAHAIPTWSTLENHIQDVSSIKSEYDYVIIGGGTAGLTVADRLSEDGEYSVLVIEHGYFYNASDPGDLRPSRQYNISSIPQQGIGNKTVPIMLGHCVGGSSAINGMAVMRGTKQEYDIWAELGGIGSTWDWDGMLPYFKKAARFIEPSIEMQEKFKIKYDIDAAWGQDEETHLYASFPNVGSPRIMNIYDAFTKIPGVEVSEDGHGGTHGLFYYPVSVDPKTGQRSYARTAHWDGLDRDNYEIITGSKVDKILFEENVAVGVTFVPKDPGNATEIKQTTVKAKKEVILAAGAIHTPQVLQLSGIGPASLLEQANIPLKYDLPGVGSNFQDHPLGPSVFFRWGTEPPLPFNFTTPRGIGAGLGAFLSLPVVSPDNFGKIAAKYAEQDLNKISPIGTSSKVLAGYRLQQEIFAREMRLDRVSFSNNLIGGFPGLMPIGLHTTSRGNVAINSLAPEAEPLVDFAALSNPIDLDLMVEYVRFARSVFNSPSLAKYAPTEIFPGNNVTSDEALEEWVRSVYTPFGYHPVGTAAKMPEELGGVVDEDLLVHGVQRLSVVDASIMPTLIGGTTQFTVYAIAEKAADLIKSRA